MIQLCACGCGQPVRRCVKPDRWCRKGDYRMFIKSHHLRAHHFTKGDPRTIAWMAK